MSASAVACATCGAALADNQRYCLECGARCAPRVAAFERVIAELNDGRWVSVSAVGACEAASGLDGSSDGAPTPASSRRVLPSPRVGAVLTLAMLAFGTLAGAAASNPAGTFGTLRRPLTLLMPARQPLVSKIAEAPPPVKAAPTPIATGETGGVQATEPPADNSSEESAGSGSSQHHGGGSAKAGGGFKLPPIKHIFLIVLADQPYAQTFGPESPAPYLAHTLEHRGELLVRDYAVAREELANEVALISGLGPTAQVAANCPVYADIIPTLPDKHGQYGSGAGCIYPVAAQTIGSQLEAKQLSWRVYAEANGNPSSGHAVGCWHPAFGVADPTTQLPAGEEFATFRDPFDYFDGVLHSPGCARDDVGLERLAVDLKSAASTPAFSYIVPDLCHDGRPTPCAPGAQGGLSAADTFLHHIVPEILASPAYRKNGLLIITTDQAPTTGEFADSSSCCFQPQFPTLASATPTLGTATPGIASGTPTPGAATSSTDKTTPSATATPPSTTATPPSAPAAASTPPPGSAPGSTTGAATATGTAPTSSSPAQPAIKLPPTGGGQVGALLLSPYIKPGTNNQEPLNDFTLLRTIEDLFGLPHLGYAGAKGVSSLEASVFSAYTGG